jgi:HD superfamily phosphohydrolase YqeK
MTAGQDIESRLRQAVAALPDRLRDHVLRVEAEAEKLGKRYGADIERARIAALGHDLVRHKTNQELLDLAAAYDLDPDPVERAVPGAGMTLLEKVLFVADKIEPGKLGRSPAWREVHDLAQRNLDLALLRFIDLRIEESLTERLPIHQRSLEARNELLAATASGGAYRDRHGLER